MTKREACARALCRRDYFNEHYIDCAGTKKNRKRLEADVDKAWKEYLPEVDAIFAELAGPDESMDQAGCQANATMSTRTNSANVLALWQAMLRAAAGGGE